jgi:hypothetical protein
MAPTLDEIRVRGLRALRQHLGRAGMIRFLQQFEHGAGDYVKERRSWVDSSTMADLRKLANRKGPKKERRRSSS